MPQTTIENNILMVSTGNKLATWTPIIAPRLVPGTKLQSKDQFTAPLLWCLSPAVKLDKLTVASEVPAASDITNSEDVGFSENRIVNAGTKIIPPPMPNKPERRPTRQPNKRKLITANC